MRRPVPDKQVRTGAQSQFVSCPRLSDPAQWQADGDTGEDGVMKCVKCEYELWGKRICPNCGTDNDDNAIRFMKKMYIENWEQKDIHECDICGCPCRVPKTIFNEPPKWDSDYRPPALVNYSALRLCQYCFDEVSA